MLAVRRLSQSGLLLGRKVPQKSVFQKRNFFLGKVLREEQKQTAVLMSIVLANVGIFISWHMAKNDARIRYFMFENFTVSARGVFDQHRYHTLVTSFYSHQDIAHLLFNMAAFYSFGSSAIAVLGVGPFLGLYLTGGILSSLFQAGWPYLIPKSWPASRNYNWNSRTLGASGAVNAVVIYSILRVPASTVLIWGILPIPGALFGVAYVAFDAYSLWQGGGEIGNAAHLAGAVVGGLLYLWQRRRRFGMKR